MTLISLPFLAPCPEACLSIFNLSQPKQGKSLVTHCLFFVCVCWGGVIGTCFSEFMQGQINNGVFEPEEKRMLDQNKPAA